MVVGSCQNDLYVLEMLSLQQVTLKVSVIQKILPLEQTLLTQWSVKTFFAISEISFEE